MKKMFLRVYSLIAVVLLLITITILISSDYIMRNTIDDFTTGLFYGPMNELANELHSSDDQCWESIVAAFNVKYAYPVSLVILEELDLSTGEKKQLEYGAIIHKLFQRKTYKQITGTTFVIAVGAVNRFGIWQKFLMFDVISLLMGFALAVYIWLRPINNSFSKLIIAADKLGNGEFSTRVHINDNSAFNKLANTFNLMAKQLELSVTTYQGLIGSISHELRSPLSRLVFGIEMFQRTSSLEVDNNYFNNIIKDVKELEYLVSELMAYARFDPNISHLDLTPLAINSWIAALLEKETNNLTKATLTWTIPESLPPLIVLFNEKALQRALDNLIRNAFKYAASLIHLRLEKAHNTIYIHVDNDGATILKEDRIRVFDAFVRLDNQPFQYTEGHGLGLAIVQNIITQHNGMVEVTDSALNGTCFTISLPMQNHMDSLR
ncbi:MAG: GHKL domain-containing protein [Desulfobacteraceae bacterium]|nr:GHKL domain-containing protein [Desulfobacteraceae bacterium]